MNPLDYLQTTSRRRRLRLPFWLLLVGLALALGAFRVPASGGAPFVLWLSAVAISLLGAWIAYTCIRPDESETARQLDAQLDARNRFEAAVELSSQSSPMAMAQRQETQNRYADLKPARAVAGIGIVALTLLLLSNLGLLVGWAVRTPSFKAVPEMAELPPDAAPEPTANIEWISPESETTSTSLEVLPLTAVATSSSGLENLELVIAVNGQEQPRMPIDADLSESGSTEVEIDVYLDLYELQPYDMVTYYLQARRVFEKEMPPTVSDLQLVQIRPFRSDVTRVTSEGGGREGENDIAANLIKKLKIAQLTLLKQNFILRHADRDNEVWPEENAKVGAEQATLTEKTNEAIDFLTHEGAPAVIVDLLTRAKSFMGDAAEFILAQENPSALKPQGQALGKLTEIEKHILKLLVESKGAGAPPTPKVKDPFDDPEEYHLPPREETPAGQLEKLAQKQEELMKELNGADPGETAQKQEEIAQQLESLSQNPEMSPKVKERMQASAGAAKESQKQLTAGDQAAAREPAARALTHLEEAIQKMRDESQADAQDLLAGTQRELSDTARGHSNPPGNENASGDHKNLRGAQAVTQARKALRQEALRQQQFGSEEFARLFAKLAEQMDDGIANLEDGKDPSTILASLSEDASEALIAIEERHLALTMTRDQLEHAAANLQRLSQTKPSAERLDALNETIGDLLISAQIAHLLLQSPAGKSASEKLWHDLTTEGELSDKDYWNTARLPVKSLIAMLDEELSGMRRDSIISLGNAEAAPEAYREAVSAYFERLSNTSKDSE